MREFIKIAKNAKIHFALILFIALSGVLIFQAQNFKPLSGDNDPRFDQPTYQYLTTFHQPRQTNQQDVVTDATGYDNFDIGVDFAEQSMVMSPLNPLQIFFGVNGSPMNHKYTTNGGLNWSVSSLSYPGGTCCDPWTAADSLGNLYYSALASQNYVAKSTNFGISFGAFVPASPGGDRNSIAVDYTGGPYSGYVYATAWSPNCSFSRSTNGGASFQTIVSGSPNTTPGNMICIGPSPNGATQGGSVYWVTITGSNPAPSTFNFFRSTDGGATMVSMSSAAISPGYVGTLNNQSRLVINNARTRPYPMIACDNSYGPYRGRLYCVYASNVPAGNGNKPDIKLQYSTNGGATWSAEVIVNDSPNPTTSDQWFPAVWCEKTTGKLYVKWYDTRANPSTYQTDVYASYSTNGGQSFVPSQRLTNASWTYPCPACSPNTNCYMGDYDAITANKKVGFAVWYDGRNCNYTNMSSYFPDYAVRMFPTSDSLRATGGDASITVVIPSVKLYSDTVLFSATITPTPAAGTFTITYPNGQAITTFPDSTHKIRIQTSGGVTNGVYTLNVKTNGPNGTPVHVRTVTLNVNNLVTGVISNITPSEWYLYQNYPNPFNPITKIGFDLVKSSNVKITVYDISGKKVEVMNLGKKEEGRHFVTFNGANLSSGVYFYKIQAGEFSDIKKMFLIK